MTNLVHTEKWVLLKNGVTENVLLWVFEWSDFLFWESPPYYVAFATRYLPHFLRFQLMDASDTLIWSPSKPLYRHRSIP